MPTMNISLPEPLKAYVDGLLSDGGYGSASEYVRELIRADQARRNDDKLDRLLLERLSSVTEQFTIDDVKNELKKRLAK